MKRKSQLTWMVAGLLVFSILVSACSKTAAPSDTAATATATANPTSEAKPTDTSAPVKHDPVVLKLITWNTTYGDLYAKFTEKYPWITIEPVIPTSGSDDQIITQIAALQAAGTPADLTWLNDMGAYTQGNLLEDLKPYIDKDESLKSKNLPDGFFQTFEINGKRFAVPFVDVPMWVLVNKDLLAKYGMEMPKNDWTYDDMRTMAQKATDPAAGEYGFTNDAIFGEKFLTTMSVANGSSSNLYFMNNDLTQSVLNTPAVLADVKWMQELMTKDGSLPGNKKAQELGDSVSNFINGKTLFDIGGDWVLEGLSKEAKFQWDVLPFPKGKVSQDTFHIYGPIGLLSGSKHKEEAYLWISFQFEMEAQKWKIDHGSNASVKDDALKAYIDESPLWKGKNTEAIKITKDLCCIAKHPIIPAYSEYTWNSTIAVVLDGKDVNTLIAPVEAWNKKTLEVRKSLGQ